MLYVMEEEYIVLAFTGGAVYTSTLVNCYQCLFLYNSAGEHGGGYLYWFQYT